MEKHGWRAALAAAMLVTAMNMSTAARAEEDEAAVAEAPWRPLVVMQQSEIQGRVFYVAESEDAEDMVASDLDIQVLAADGKKVLQKTKTDKEGRYVLRNLPVGTYGFRVGRLDVELTVEKGEQAAKAKGKLAKKILIFIPHSLGEEAEAAAEDSKKK